MFAEARGARVLIAVAKLGAAASFLAAAWLWGATATPYGRTLLAGLSLCAVGDALLLARGAGQPFLLGIGAFLLGHVAYLAAFAGRPLSAPAGWAAGAVLLALAVWVLRWLWPHVPAQLRPAVLCYVLVIGTMTAVAFAAWGAGTTPLVALGALGFAVSDLSVARDRFVASRVRNRAWGLPLYFGAQLLLASTVRAVS